MAFTITSFTGNYGLVDADRGNLRKATDTVAQTITLDTALGASWACNVENANTGITPATNAVVLKPTSGTVDGASTFTMYRGEVRGVDCDGTNWVTICIRMGDSRFDGITPLVKNLDAANQVVVAEQWAMNTSDFTWVFPGASTLLAWISTNDTLTLQGSTRYHFEFMSEVTHGTTSHAHAVGFAGSATFTDIAYQTISGVGNAQGGLTPSLKQIIAATNATIQTGITAASTVIYGKGEMAINAAGTLVPSFAMSADPTGTILIKKGSFFRIWAVGNSTIGAVGAWS